MSGAQAALLEGGRLHLNHGPIDLIIEAGICLEGFGVVHGYIGDSLTDVFARYGKLAGA